MGSPVIRPAGNAGEFPPTSPFYYDISSYRSIGRQCFGSAPSRFKVRNRETTLFFRRVDMRAKTDKIGLSRQGAWGKTYAFQ